MELGIIDRLIESNICLCFQIRNTGASIIGARRSPHRQTVTKKTRVYVVDGVQMTSTSHQVFGVKQDYELRLNF